MFGARPSGGLAAKHQLRARHQRARDRELLLAAGERPAACPRRSARPEALSRRVPDAGGSCAGSSPSRGSRAPTYTERPRRPSGQWAMLISSTRRGWARDVLAFEFDPAARRADDSRSRVQSPFAGAVRADEADEPSSPRARARTVATSAVALQVAKREHQRISRRDSLDDLGAPDVRRAASAMIRPRRHTMRSRRPSPSSCRARRAAPSRRARESLRVSP